MRRWLQAARILQSPVPTSVVSPSPTLCIASVACCAVSYLEPLKTAENAVLPLELLTRDKTDGNAANYAALVEALRSSHAGASVATLGKEQPQGEFATAWRAKLAESGLTQVELAPAFANMFAQKDSVEANYVKRCALPLHVTQSS